MSRYSINSNQSYTSPKRCPVSLQKYIIIDELESNKKLILFQFINNFKYKVKSISFELVQYDSHNQEIDRQVLAYDNFEIKEPLFSDAYKNAHFPKENITLQGFLYTSDYNYIENDVSDLNTPHSIFIKGNFSKVFGIYEIFHGDEYGACDVILNGEQISVINSKSIFGWMTPKDIRIIDLAHSSYNELELRITKSSAKKVFKIKLMIS